MYTGQANVQEEALEEFFEICRTFKVEGIDNMAEQTLVNHVNEITKNLVRDNANKIDVLIPQLNLIHGKNEDYIKRDIEAENYNLVNKFFEDESSEDTKQDEQSENVKHDETSKNAKRDESSENAKQEESSLNVKQDESNENINFREKSGNIKLNNKRTSIKNKTL